MRLLDSKRAKHRGFSVVLNGSRGVLNSSARDALAATPPHALRARNLHTPPPTCPPSRPAPALASRPPPKTAPPRYAARTRRLPRALPSRVPRPFPASAPVARARPIARGAETDATRALHAPWHLSLACARGVAPPRRVLPPTRGDARGSPRRAFQNVPLLSWLGSSDPPRPRPPASAPPDPRRAFPARRRRRGARGARRDPRGARGARRARRARVCARRARGAGERRARETGGDWARRRERGGARRREGGEEAHCRWY